MTNGNVEPMRIGRLARRTGVSVKALRFYDSHIPKG